MLPRDLQIEQFAAYPPQAKKLIAAYLGTVRELPLSFIPSLLREVIEYDFKFPAERSSIDKEFVYLASLTPPQRKQLFLPFAQVTLSAGLERFDWINLPAQFVEQQSSYLWSTHQLDAFRKAATEYGAHLNQFAPPDQIPIQRLGIAVIGQGTAAYDAPLFRNLRKHGTYFAKVKPDRGLELLFQGITARAKAHPVPYAHWYVDGGAEIDHDASLTCVSYKNLESLRATLLKRMQTEIEKPGMGPEELRTHMARLTPLDIGMDNSGDAILNRFAVKLFTEGSGTQIYSTTFAQWTTREILRRAQALTLLVRFAPRQRQRPMNELLANSGVNVEVDLPGSLVDADMASYYHWINQQRLPGSERSSFLVWFEGHTQALAIAPSLPRGTESSSSLDLGELLSLVSA